MKHKLILLFAILGCSISAWAQHNVVLNLKDGSKIVWQVTQIDSISIVDDDRQGLQAFGTPVDLGLRVKWSDINIGARQPSDFGWLVGWGDPTGQQMSDDLSAFPAFMSSIVGTSYDIAHAMWASQWRMPTDEDVEELVSNCDWTKETLNGVEGWRVTGRGDYKQNSIFLPLGGKRVANVYTEQDVKGYYWTGLPDENAQSAAKLLLLPYADRQNLFTAIKRSTGCAVRPVYGEDKSDVRFQASDVETGTLTTTSVNLNFKFDAYLGNVSEAGFIYGPTSALDIDTVKVVLSELKEKGEADYMLTNLIPNTTYFYRLYVIYRGELKRDDVKSFTTLDYLKPEKVDLGFGSVQWASFNLGATTPAGQGILVGWADPTALLRTTDLNDYPSATPPTVIAAGTYDVASAKLGEQWRMPTNEELQMLVDSCDWAWTTIDGSLGYELTSKKNGQKLFLPVTGLRNGEDIASTTAGYYWSATLATTNSAAMGMELNVGSHRLSSILRSRGCAVRPVYGSYVVPMNVTTESAYEVGATSAKATLGMTASSVNGVTQAGFVYGTKTELDATKDSTVSTTTIPADGKVSLTMMSLNRKTTYHYRAYVLYNGEYIYGAMKEFVTNEYYTKPHVVDLGLTVKWADMNLGADDEAQPGILVGWGDITGTNHTVITDDYPYSTPDPQISATYYDTVQKLLNDENWRMPTYDEIKELVENCAWIRTTKDGVDGYQLISIKSSSTIFMPVTGLRRGDVVSSPETGNYWTGTLGIVDTQKAFALQFEANQTEYRPLTMEQWRYMGLAIRPVYGGLNDYVKVGEPSIDNVTTTSAEVGFTVEGDLRNATSYGVKYGTSVDNLNLSAQVRQAPEEYVKVQLTELASNTAYYCQPFVEYRGEIKVGTTKVFKTDKQLRIGSAIDLGIDGLAWADINLGADTESDAGILVGWGDITMMKESSLLEEYPVNNPTGDIINSRYDLALNQWGDDWRLPSEADYRKLLTNCDWKWETVGAIGGWRVSNKSDATKNIFLPVTGIRENGGISEETTTGYYWTGTLDTSNADNAKALMISATAHQLTTLKRYMGVAVRPVKGAYKDYATITVGEATNVLSSSAVVSVTMDGDLKNITEWGMLCGTDEVLTAEQHTKSKSTTMPDFGQTAQSLTSLSPGNTYYYKAYAIYKGDTVWSEQKNFETPMKYPKAEPVDLHLPSGLRWANWAMGATKVGEKGKFFGWGETEGIESTSVGMYARGCTLIDIAGSDWDVAHAHWGGYWRLPKMTELEELGTRYREWTANYVDEDGNATGLAGLYFYSIHRDSVVLEIRRSREDGSLEIINFRNDNVLHLIDSTKVTRESLNKIFIPIMGSKYDGNIRTDNATLLFWSSERRETGTKAYYASFTASGNDISYTDYCILMTVLPVYDDPNNTSSPGEEEEPESPNAGEAVDLGLSVLWANYNVGASTELQGGNYFAWGTTTSGGYTPETYIFNEPSTGSYKDIGYFISGNKEYDAAAANWKGKWRMPSSDEFDELVENCTWTYEENNAGWRVTGSTGKSIFLPMPGYISGGSIVFAGDQGFYWSDRVYTRPTDFYMIYAYGLLLAGITKNTVSVMPNDRCVGGNIRPVRALPASAVRQRIAQKARQVNPMDGVPAVREE